MIEGEDMINHDEQGPLGGVTPHLAITGGRAIEAVAFYERAFGATLPMPPLKGEDSGLVMHAHLQINGGSLMIADEFPGFGPSKGSGGPITLHLQVDDVDIWYARALEAGCVGVMPPADMFWGDRYGQLRDPFGQTWAIGAALKGDK